MQNSWEQQQQKDKVNSLQLSHDRKEQEKILLDNILKLILCSLIQTVLIWELLLKRHQVAIQDRFNNTEMQNRKKISSLEPKKKKNPILIAYQRSS